MRNTLAPRESMSDKSATWASLSPVPFEPALWPPRRSSSHWRRLSVVPECMTVAIIGVWPQSSQAASNNCLLCSPRITDSCNRAKTSALTLIRVLGNGLCPGGPNVVAGVASSASSALPRLSASYWSCVIAPRASSSRAGARGRSGDRRVVMFWPFRPASSVLRAATRGTRSASHLCARTVFIAEKVTARADTVKPASDALRARVRAMLVLASPSS